MRYPTLKTTVFTFALLTPGAFAGVSALAEPTPSGPAASVSYQFTAVQHDDLVGTVYEVDFVDSDSHETPVLEIAAGTKTLSQMDRAKIIAERLQAASLADRSFWNDLKPTTKNSQIVVALNTPDAGLILTADRNSAVLTGMSPDQYAGFLLKQIKTALVGKLRDAKFDYQLDPAEKLERANIYRQQAERAYQRQDESRAESQYRQATKVAPRYTVAYLGLASLYVHQGKLEKAKSVLRAARTEGLNLTATAQQLMPGRQSPLATMIAQVKNGG